MTDVVSTSEDVIVQVPQPVIPPSAPPVKVGLVEISPISQRGSMWMTGHGAPSTPGGQVGDMYLNMDNGDVYRWDGAAWQYQGTFAPSTLTAAEILALLVTVDGTGSGLDADLLDGHDTPYFATQAALTTEKNRNDTQDTSIATNITNIGNNASAIADLQTATTPANLLTSIKTVDGTGSGLDADTLDGHDTTYFGTAAADTTLQNNINLKADIASPTFTGDPRAPTPAVSDNDTSIATTAFVKSVTSTIVPFPEAPQDGLTYGRKSGTWATVIGGAHTDDLPPPGPLVDGQLWWKSDTGTFYVYYDDGNSKQWVEAAAPPVPATSALTGITSINGGPLAGFRNKLINSLFLINQSSAVASGALPANQQWYDCWKVGPSGCTLSAAGNPVVVTITAGTLVQIMLGEDFATGTYCISWTGTAPCTVDGVAVANGGSFTLTGGTSSTVSFGVGTVSSAQVEPGVTPTPFERRPYSLEMTMCQWRYEIVQASVAFWNVVQGTFQYVSVPYNRKRVTPSLASIGNVVRSNVASDLFANVATSGATYSVSGTTTTGVTVQAVTAVAVDARP